MSKRTSRKRLLLRGSVLLLVTLLSLASCRAVRVIRSRLTIRDEGIAALFDKQTEKPQVHYWKSGKRRIRYLTIGADSLPPVLLLHGSPGSWSSWRGPFFDTALYHHVRLIAPDRPGYGFSDYGRSFARVDEEAAFLQTFIDSVAPDGPLVIAGSSYGGSVAVPLAIRNAHRMRGLLLISASLQPGAEKIYGITPIIRDYKLRLLVPRLLRMPNDEKLAHYESLAAIRGWEAIRCPVYILHGEADKLVYFSNAEYARQKLENARVTLVPFPGIGHTINWKMPDTVRHYLRQLIRP